MEQSLKFAFSNVPANTSCIAAVRLWKSRWPVEPGDQQLKDELGRDHFEGRSGRGFHHHAAMTILAYGFLLLERHRAEQDRQGRVKNGGAGLVLTLPGIRRALQRLLMPLAKLDCPYCRSQGSRPQKE